MCSKSNGLTLFLGHRPAYCLHGGKSGTYMHLTSSLPVPHIFVKL